MCIIILPISYDVVIGTVLPNVFAKLLVAKPFQCGNELCNHCVLCRVGLLSHGVFFYYQKNMDVVWHNDVTIDNYMVIKIVQLVDVFINSSAVTCQFHTRTVEDFFPTIAVRACGKETDAGPYNAGQYALFVFCT